MQNVKVLHVHVIKDKVLRIPQSGAKGVALDALLASEVEPHHFKVTWWNVIPIFVDEFVCLICYLHLKKGDKLWHI